VDGPLTTPPEPTRRAAITVEDCLWFVDLALAQMTALVRELGDDRANRRLDVAGSNSPYAILTHCLGVMEFWGGATVAGRAVERDRAAEFVATGTVDELVRRAETSRRRLHVDAVVANWEEAPSGRAPQGAQEVPYDRSKGAVMLHIVEELFQHLGQMEVTRDVLMREGPAS